jgi:uncharacterized protein (TIGR00299 family) protein
MTIAYFDCFSGAAGDMIVGALIDAGAPVDRLREILDGLNVPGFRIEAEKVSKQHFAATRFCVHVEPGDKPHRHLKDVLGILHAGKLSECVRADAARIFTRLAEAEAVAHGVPVEKIHFHEVGAIDAIVDVVAAVAALDLLGVRQVICSPLVVGSGVVRAEHGAMPVPAPGTAALLRGVPIAECDEPGELLTPTGAAVLTTLAERYGPLPSLTPQAIGYGVGTREGRHRPNLLRVILGSPIGDPGADEVVILEANLDDCTGEAVGHCLDRLFEAGALDAYCLPIQMKKSRPGLILTALADPADVDRLEDIIFRETTTFGVRRQSARRSRLAREHQTVQTPFGTVRMKIGRKAGHVVTASPEFEDCRRLAHEAGVALRMVMDAARSAWERNPG